MENIIIKDGYIRLGQALKLTGMVSSGVEAKVIIQNGQVKVNDCVELQRGKKIRPGDVVEYNGYSFQIAESKE